MPQWLTAVREHLRSRSRSKSPSSTTRAVEIDTKVPTGSTGGSRRQSPSPWVTSASDGQASVALQVAERGRSRVLGRDAPSVKAAGPPPRSNPSTLEREAAQQRDVVGSFEKHVDELKHVSIEPFNIRRFNHGTGEFVDRNTACASDGLVAPETCLWTLDDS